MPDPEIATLRKNLDDLSSRLNARTKEFREQGGFSDVHQELENEIRRRRDEMQEKIAQAEGDKPTWELMKVELARDYNSLFDDLLMLEEMLDAETTKHTE